MALFFVSWHYVGLLAWADDTQSFFRWLVFLIATSGSVTVHQIMVPVLVVSGSARVFSDILKRATRGEQIEIIDDFETQDEQPE